MIREPELYGGYLRDEAVAIFDLAGQVPTSFGDDWVILTDAILCLADVGDIATGSYFGSGSRFNWVPARPCEAAGGRASFFPREVRGGKNRDDRPIHLFARPKEAQHYVYLGLLSDCYAWGTDREHPNGIAHFDLLRTLPSVIWRKYGGAIVNDEVGDDEIDRLVSSLRTSATSTQRLHFLDRLIDYWHGPWLPEHGFSEAELQGSILPDPLRWIYQKSGRRPVVMSNQNRLLGPEKLKLGEDGKLLFHVENQGVYLYATTPVGDDPPVWSRANEDGVPWTEEGLSLSSFLIGSCLMEAILQAPYGASASWADAATLERITSPLNAFPIGPLRFPADPSRFWASDGTFVFSCPNGEVDGVPGFSIWIGSRTERPLAYLKTISDVSWDNSAF